MAAAPGALWVALDSAHPSQCILVRDTGAVQPCPAARKRVRVVGIVTLRRLRGLSSQAAMAAAKKKLNKSSVVSKHI